jgi:oligopeptide/dipeptide ABC transporter ATP-binding protein
VALLEVADLRVEYRREGHAVPAVRGVSLGVEAGETVGLVGESGCGKSTLALALLRLLPERSGRVTGGRITFEGKDVLSLSDAALREVRGGGIGMIFQDPFSALNPVLTAGEQVLEMAEAHGAGGPERVLELLERVKLPDAKRVRDAYPHQLSGGQRQRVVMAMAIAARPRLLVADEPTTALDASLQKDVLDLLDGLQKDMGLAMLFITHNMNLVAERTRRLAVMYAGEVVESGPTERVLREPLHPYTQALLKSLPRLGGGRGPLPIIPGQPPDPRALPTGCAFHPRCGSAFAPCASAAPRLQAAQGRDVACHLHHPSPQAVP